MKFIIFLLVSFIGVMGMALKLTYDTSMVFKSKNSVLEKQNQKLIMKYFQLKVKVKRIKKKRNIHIN